MVAQQARFGRLPRSLLFLAHLTVHLGCSWSGDAFCTCPALPQVEKHPAFSWQVGT